MKRKIKLSSIITIVLIICVLTACSPKNQQTEAEPSASVLQTTAADEINDTTQEKDMNKINVTVGDKTFTATLYDNETAKEFVNLLPLTVDMQELHNNEKYYYFENALPNASSVPELIQSGDIKLFGSDCLVLFYDDLTTSYSYTDIGKIDNPDGLKEALGKGDVTVTFSE